MKIGRFREKILARDWFGLLLDLVIVIIGIFLGLLFNSIYNDWQDRQEEKNYLRRLADDVSTSINMNKDNLLFMKQQTEDAKIVLQSLQECSIDPDDEIRFANGLHHIQTGLPPQQVMSTIVELQSTGNLAIIQSVQIREGITSLLKEIDDTKNVMNAMIARGAPNAIYVERFIDYNIDAPFDARADIPLGVLNVEIKEFCEDAQFRRSIKNSTRYVNDLSFRIIQVIKIQKELYCDISRELGVIACSQSSPASSEQLAYSPRTHVDRRREARRLGSPH